MQRIPQLPPWNLTNPLPAFHDYESLSAIDQTARLYGAMRGLIDDYNKFANSVNETIINYHNDLNADQEQFKNEINQLVHDYIIALDAKIAHQDRVIEENITYIKENLATAVESTIAQMKESGELAEAIGDSFNALGERIQTLESAVAELNAFKTNSETRIKTLETKAQQLELEEGKTKEAISKIEDTKNKFTKMITFGDSWTGNTQNSDGTGTLSNDGNNWATRVASTLGLALENYAIGGWAIAGDEHGLLTQINNALNNISIEQRDNYKYIFVLMGVNDWQGTSSIETIQQKLKQSLVLLKESFPKSQIVFIPLNYFAENLDTRARDIYNICLVEAQKNNVILIPNFYNYLNMFGNLFYKDETNISSEHPYAHPNEEGHELISLLVSSALNGKCYPFDFPLLFTYLENEKNITLQKQVIRSNTEYLSISGEIHIPANTTLNKFTWYDIGRITYGGKNVFVNRYENSINNYIIPYHDNFVRLKEEKGLLIYLSKDGKLTLICDEDFTSGSEYILVLNEIINRSM